MSLVKNKAPDTVR